LISERIISWLFSPPPVPVTGGGFFARLAGTDD